MNLLRAVLVIVVSVLAVGQIVRQAYVNKYAVSDPVRAGALWARHPDVAFKLDLDRIARASAAGKPVPRDRIDDILARSAAAPLAVEPFLVRGVDAGLAGNLALAGRALHEARHRDPRSIPARYFLADHDLKTNRIDEGFAELAALTRLVPGSIDRVALYYAAYASQPGGAMRVREMLRTHPEFESAVLMALAADPRQADLILSLATAHGVKSDPPPSWPGKLVQGLVDAGQFAKARAVWASLAGPAAASGEAALVLDPRFERLKAPAPFGWTLASSASGVAEAQPGGRLHLLFFGRDNVVLASQLLLLRPGRYRLSFDVERSADASALGWRLTCLPPRRPLFAIDFGKQAQGKTVGGGFAVTGDCPAQLLELVGTAPEFPETVDATLSSLSLIEVAG